MRQIELFPAVSSIVGVIFSIFFPQAITAGVFLLLAHKEWTQRHLVNIETSCGEVERFEGQIASKLGWNIKNMISSYNWI